jgi:flavodoxin
MKKALVAYFSITGTTATMARYIAEGVRIAGHDAETKDIKEISNRRALLGYDAYIFGCPTHHLGIPDPFRAFLSMVRGADFQGKIGGAFSSSGHPSSTDDSAAKSVFRVMESELNMKMTGLGPFDLKPEWLDTGKPELISTWEGMRTCQDYGRSVGEMLS